MKSRYHDSKGQYDNPDDPGVFIPSSELGYCLDIDLSSRYVGGGSVHEFDNPGDNPHPELKYLVAVGGGYRGFKRLSSARAYLNSAP